MWSWLAIGIEKNATLKMKTPVSIIISITALQAVCISQGVTTVQLVIICRYMIHMLYAHGNLTIFMNE